MEHLEHLRAVFRSTLRLAPGTDVDGLEYRAIPQWDSLAHMALVAALEDEFDIMLETDDVLGMNSFGRAVEILEKQGVTVRS
ncbi:acyl carrier protein [Streptosporangium becharense]|uniref:Acyl carrier protein n=1 Tax=Streptosporangium becharense TaxID=1816182 RepID=A0A7W9IF15_9ACTN|nr:acyl carrier protein [Streptosporangium becharense]MBB2909518.1 acyl carrier protein [Streptosporangium becharense]MBB5819525.1 acyl carrier protein [Streptosporangium becharense]